jgi:hypothetical protein
MLIYALCNFIKINHYEMNYIVPLQHTYNDRWHFNKYFMMKHHSAHRTEAVFLSPEIKFISLPFCNLYTSDARHFCICSVIGICNSFESVYLIFQEFHFPLSVVVCHLVFKFVTASLCRMIWECCTSKQRIVLNWRNYVKKVAPTGISSGLDIGLSNWGLELIPVSL